EEDRVGMDAVHLVDQPLPERERLRVGVVDAEETDTASDPEENDVAQRFPQRPPRSAFEIEEMNVLEDVRRVLGALDRAVGTMAKPFRVLAQPRMIRRALEGQVERDLEPVRARRRDVGIEVREGAERRLD